MCSEAELTCLKSEGECAVCVYSSLSPHMESLQSIQTLRRESTGVGSHKVRIQSPRMRARSFSSGLH